MKTQSVEEDYDFLFKIVLIGDSGTGKTNILTQFIKGEFFDDSKPTIGVEFATKTINLDEKVNIKCQFWDTAGQERQNEYRSITSAYYRGSIGAIILYDVTNKNSLGNVERWLEELKSHADPEIQVLLIGNKIDLKEERVCTTQDGKDVAEQLNIAFIETSALENQNVEKAFYELIRMIYEKTGVEESLLKEGQNQETIKVVDENKEEKKGCC